MEIKEINTMQEYCENIKHYFNVYSDNQINVELYGDVYIKLKEIISTADNEQEFFIRINELVGSVTRVLQGSFSDVSFYKWIGGLNESFTKEYFLTTMRTILPDL